jgi:hypothetical protein
MQPESVFLEPERIYCPHHFSNYSYFCRKIKDKEGLLKLVVFASVWQSAEPIVQSVIPSLQETITYFSHSCKLFNIFFLVMDSEENMSCYFDSSSTRFHSFSGA